MKNSQTVQNVIGIDLGDKKHAVCVVDKHGTILKEYSIRNQANSLSKLARAYPQALIAMEVGTHSPWISRLFEKEGLSVLVANARKLRAIYTNERKCDELDARMLAKIARLDPELLHPIKHGSEQAQRDQLTIKMRESLVRSRVAIVNAIRGTLKSLGVRLPSPSTCSFAGSVREFLADQPDLLGVVEPSLQALDELSRQIKGYEKTISQNSRIDYPETELLQSIPGVGPITALSFVLAVGDPERFQNPRDIGAWLGLVPRRDQSGHTDKQLPISKAGNRHLRSLLVQCAHYMLGAFGPDSDLRRYGLKLAARGGKAAKKKAVVAVARKLAVVMFTLWRTGHAYIPLRYPKRHQELAS